ncbi:hypothetical protein [Sphingomonas immobilis]|uniref:DUF3558 domain-containing protein n=1 Tax=Sphingomonas immobilis TaxID=3063997 RepID=A0ABT9A1A7_9SPHN|nr:hypothetical protein [Sphingomonas sp. CA1-15]MDO7843242.1 hypothetical protein [Sphingomonas sp. CA1-15]
MRAAATLAMMAFATGACTPRDKDGYPPFARKVLDQTIQDPKELRGGGSFEVTPATVFCTYRPGFGMDLDTWFGKGLPTGTFGPQTTPNCRVGNKNNPVFARSQTIANRNGKAIKVAFTIWQGAAAITGVAEQSTGVSGAQLRELRSNVTLHFSQHIDPNSGSPPQ